MRIDKFLKVSRLIKRRTVASEACQTGRVRINGDIAKASTKVQEGDIIEITFAENVSKVKILSISESRKKDDAKNMYELIA